MEKFARTSHYISELLFVHDCVIVPSFGERYLSTALYDHLRED